MSTPSASVACRLAQLLELTGGNFVRAEALFVSGEPPSAQVEGALYAFAGLSGATGLLAGANLVVKLIRGAFWLVRTVPTPYGDYWSPNASVMFSIASVLMACTAEGIVASAILMWKGRVVDGYLLINTLGWLPLFAAGVATVWGTAVASISLSRSQRSPTGAAPLPEYQPRIPPAVFNALAIILPTIVCIAIPVLFVLAQLTFDEAVKIAEDAVQAANFTSPAAAVAFLCQPLDFGPIADVESRFLAAEARAMRITRAGFGVWTGAVLGLFVVWLPYQLSTHTVLTRQLRQAARLRRRELRRRKRALAADSYTQFPAPNGSRREASVAAQANQEPGVNMEGAYRSLLGSALCLTVMILSYAALSTLALVSPVTIVRGTGNRVLLLTSVGLFGTFGLLITIVNLWRSLAARPVASESHASPASNKAASSTPRSPLLPSTASTFSRSPMSPLEPWMMEHGWDLAAPRRARNDSTISRLSA